MLYLQFYKFFQTDINNVFIRINLAKLISVDLLTTVHFDKCNFDLIKALDESSNLEQGKWVWNWSRAFESYPSPTWEQYNISIAYYSIIKKLVEKQRKLFISTL